MARSRTAGKTTGSLLSASVKYAILCFYVLMDRAREGAEREERESLSIAIKTYMLFFFPVLPKMPHRGHKHIGLMG